MPYNGMRQCASRRRPWSGAETIYFGYRRKPLANARADAGQATLGSSDGLDIFVADRRKGVGIRLAVKRNGSAVARLGTLGVSRKTDPRWKGEWQHAVQGAAAGWVAEVALPLRTLTQSGMALDRLQLNCMSQNLTRSGLEGIFVTDPYYGVRFRSCCRFRRLVRPPANPPPKRSFTVRLHFAEPDPVGPGRRVFDVALQGSTVLRGLDVVKEAGGRHRALVKEFRGVGGTGQIVIELTPNGEPGKAAMEPVISGVEIVEEK